MESKNLLNGLANDRAALASRVRTPWWLAAGFGFMAACFVVSPAFDGNVDGVVIASAVMACGLISAYRAATGVKLSASGRTMWLILALAVASVLTLFSVSLGLASLGLHGWIAVPTALAVVAAAALTYLSTRVARERMRHVD